MGPGVCVVPDVVARGNCIGCGTCAAVCPTGALEISFSDTGYLLAGFTDSPCTECARCIRVCPFAAGTPDTDTIAGNLYGTDAAAQHHHSTGYWVSAHVGAVRDPISRHLSASGGVTTALLVRLLESGTVDRVATVVPTGTSDRLFDYRLLGDSESIFKAAGSAYYPVSMHDVLRVMIDDPRPTAVVALPCVARALRLAAARHTSLARSVHTVVGLTCGQTTGRCMVEYLAARAGVPAKQVHHVRFRHKSDRDRTAQDFGVVIESSSQTRLTWAADMGPVFTAGAFVPQACQFCDDAFAECADITLMDAWLPDIIQDERGTNLLLSRTLEMSRLLSEMHADGVLDLERASLQSVITSQASVLARKREGLAARLASAAKESIATPPTRVQAATAHGLRERLWRARWAVSRDSAVLWRDTCDVRAFDAALQRRMRPIRRTDLFLRMLDAVKRRISRLTTNREEES